VARRSQAPIDADAAAEEIAAAACTYVDRAKPIGSRRELRIWASGGVTPGGGALALRAMPVTARVVGDEGVSALLATCNVAAESRRAAALDRRHHLERHPGELIPRVGFIVTNMNRPAERVVAFYNKRGTREQGIKEGKGAINWTRLS
jgi:hypothetical protein